MAGVVVDWAADRRALAALAGVYVAASWWYAIPFGLVWDDWVILAHSAQSMFAVASEAGRASHALLIFPFHESGQPWTWALAAWLCLGGAVGLIFLTARRIRGVTLSEAFWISALTATAPLYQARFTLSVLPYAFSALFFTASLFLLSDHLNRPGPGRRVGGLVCLLLACTTESFLTLCWMPPALIAWDTFAANRNSRSIGEALLKAGRKVLSHFEFVVLPALVFLLGRVLFPAHGIYANYNQLKLSPVLAIRETVSVLWAQIFQIPVIVPDLSSVVDAALPAALLVAIGWVIWKRFRPVIVADSPKHDRAPLYVRLMLLALALLTPVFALYPYVIVQQPPRLLGLWETRHQLTLMLVSGGVLLCFFRSFGSLRALNVAAAIVIFVFLTLDYGAARQFLVDRLEQRELQLKLAANPLPPEALVLTVESDRTLRMFGRFFAFYELTHLANQADGRDDRLLVSNREIIDPETGTYATTPNLRVVEKMLRNCTLRARPEFGFAGFSYQGTVTQLSLDPKVGWVPLVTAIGLTLSGGPTDWIELNTKSFQVPTPMCGPIEGHK
jgi:hypothetical protein